MSLNQNQFDDDSQEDLYTYPQPSSSSQDVRPDAPNVAAPPPDSRTPMNPTENGCQSSYMNTAGTFGGVSSSSGSAQAVGLHNHFNGIGTALPNIMGNGFQTSVRDVAQPALYQQYRPVAIGEHVYYMNYPHGVHNDAEMRSIGSERQKRTRTVFTDVHKKRLTEEYRKSKYLDQRRRLSIAYSLKLTEKTVKIWFQNQRMAEKKRERELSAARATMVKSSAESLEHAVLNSVDNNLVQHHNNYPVQHNYINSVQHNPVRHNYSNSTMHHSYNSTNYVHPNISSNHVLPAYPSSIPPSMLNHNFTNQVYELIPNTYPGPSSMESYSSSIQEPVESTSGELDSEASYGSPGEQLTSLTVNLISSPKPENGFPTAPLTTTLNDEDVVSNLGNFSISDYINLDD